MPMSENIEDRRGETTNVDALMQMPLDELQTTLNEMGKNAPKPIPMSEVDKIMKKLKKKK